MLDNPKPDDLGATRPPHTQDANATPALTQESPSPSDGMNTSSPPESPRQTTPSATTTPNWPLHYLWVSILGVSLFYIFLLPEIQIAWWNTRKPNRLLPASLQLDLVTRSLLRTLEAFVIAFFFAVGASIGSFLNVVAYRLPQGLDISVEGSRCPSCRKHLSWRENLPIFGWLSLRGRCGGCGVTISRKYLAAEVLLGSIAVWIGVQELLSGGINLPQRTPNFYAGVVWIIFYTKWDLVSYALFHFTLFSVLSTQMLILDNHFVIPKRFIFFCLLLGMSLSLSFPWLHLVHSSVLLPYAEPPEMGQAVGLKPEWPHSSMPSIAIGFLYTALISIPFSLWAWFISCSDPTHKAIPYSATFAYFATFAYVGIWFGWQAELAVGVASLTTCSLIVTLHPQVQRRSFLIATVILATTALHHTFWNAIVSLALEHFA